MSSNNKLRIYPTVGVDNIHNPRKVYPIINILIGNWLINIEDFVFRYPSHIEWANKTAITCPITIAAAWMNQINLTVSIVLKKLVVTLKSPKFNLKSHTFN